MAILKMTVEEDDGFEYSEVRFSSDYMDWDTVAEAVISLFSKGVDEREVAIGMMEAFQIYLENNYGE